ncbi:MULTISPECIES: hypothetical protein [Pseudonocardia]|nr:MULTISPECIES: hypothetical protein [Pseudonocardia]
MRDDTAPAPARPAVVHLRPVDLERFWPSRRLDAFDEFCRPC